MYISPRISIRTKILFVLSAVVIAAVALYLYLASKLFYEDKTLLVYELNQTNVRTVGEETETYFKRIIDKMKILASLQGGDVATHRSVMKVLSEQEDGVLRMGLLTRDERGLLKTEHLGSWMDSLAQLGVGVGYLGEISAHLPIPFDEVLKKGIWIRNSTPPAKADGSSTSNSPVMTMATVAQDGRSVIFADLKLDHVLKSVSRTGIAKIYLADSDGMTLAHPDARKVLEAQSLKGESLIQMANATKVRSEVKKFKVAEKEVLGSFYKLTTGGVIVASEIEADQAFVAAQVLIQKSFWYALMAVTAAFLIALFLSHSLTVPIQHMVEATQRIAQGDFEKSVSVTTTDELAQLARSFNSMTTQLQTTQQQLVHSERMAAIGQVARSIGHEFGNILLAIVGNADLALASGDSSKVRKNLQTILQAADRATLIVRNLQSFSKSTSVRMPTDPNALIKATLTLLQHETTKHSVNVIECCSARQSIEVNAAEIEQVVLNLIINAIHAMPEGGNIEVGTEDQGDQIRLWVRDSGCGIAPEVLPRIFDYAFTTKGSKGSGLGLAISKQIIEKHSGKLEVETEAGKGTLFNIFLPSQVAVETATAVGDA